MGKDPTTFVASDHGFAPQFLAIDASQVLVDLGLLSRPQTSNCRPATGETIGKAKACWAGGAVQIYLNLAGPRPGRRRRSPRCRRPTSPRPSRRSRPTFLGLTDPNDWTHDGQPEGWKVIDRAFTKAEARYIPNGPGTTADMAHPTRTGDLVVFSYPPYQFDAETPGTLIAPSHFFGQHGYVPDVQDLAANINMRATFLAGGKGIAKGTVNGAVDRPGADAGLHARHPRARSTARAGCCSTSSRAARAYKPLSIVGLNDFHGQLEPDDARRSTGINQPRRRRAPFLATLFDEELARAARAGPDPGGRRQRRRLAAELAAARGHAGDRRRERLGPGRDLVRQPRVRLRRRAAARPPGAGATSRSWRPTSSRRRPARRPPWVTPSKVFTVNGVKVGVIGAELENTPELVSAGATAGLTFLAEAPADQGRVRAPAQAGRQGADRRHPPGHERRPNTDRQRRRRALGRARSSTSPTRSQDTTVDAMVVGHTHRVSNLMRGHILITEGINAGDELLRPPADGQGRGRRLGRRRDARRQEPRRRRSGADVQAIVDDAERRDGGAAQPGDRDAS